MNRRNAQTKPATSSSAPAIAAGQRTAQTAVPTKRKGWLRKHGVTLFLVLVFLAGLGMLLYPTISNWWNNLHQSQVVANYMGTASNLEQERIDAMLKDARSYNKRLAKTGQLWFMTDAENREYNRTLNVDGTGVMGYVTIPKINVQLPIYHGTDEGVLQTSIGHLAGTSLPVGGKSSHCVLSGHRGLPSARLFTDLDQLRESDTFTLTVLDKTLTYEVDQIRIVEPDDISDLQIEPGKDYCTLVTCTPYGINTQRLLVRGHRVPNADGGASVLADAVIVRPMQVAPFVALGFLVVLVTYVFVSTRKGAVVGDAVGAYLAARAVPRPRPRYEELAEGVGEDGDASADDASPR